MKIEYSKKAAKYIYSRGDIYKWSYWEGVNHECDNKGSNKSYGNFAREWTKFCSWIYQKISVGMGSGFYEINFDWKKELEDADSEIRNGETVSHEEINWD